MNETILERDPLSMSGHARSPGTASATRSVARSVPAITVAMLLPNTDTKLLFRSTHGMVQRYVAELCPLTGRWPSVADGGSPPRCGVGECYGVLADGRLERRRLRPFGTGRIGPLTGRKRVAAAPRRGVLL